MLSRRSLFVRAFTIALATATLAACSGDDAKASQSNSSSSTKPDLKPAAKPKPAPKPAADLDLAPIWADLTSFWATQGTAVGVPGGVTVDPVRLQPLGGAPVICEGEAIPEDEAVDNAEALSCAEGPAVVWDPAYLREITTRFGSASAALVVAHEWGHLLDFASPEPIEDDFVSEQYADCLAGVWAASAYERNSAPFNVPGALDQVIASSTMFRDDPTDTPSHGSAFDRIRAFDDGFGRGAATCAGYRATPPSLIDADFTMEERTSDAQLSFKDALDYADAAVAEFMDTHPDPFRTAEPELTSMTRKDLADLTKRLGDTVPLVMTALDTSAAAQAAQGEDPGDEGPLLQQACWTGALLGWLARGESELELAPGDLDEAVGTFIDVTDPADSGFLFEQIAQMRVGVTDGVSACTVTR